MQNKDNIKVQDIESRNVPPEDVPHITTKVNQVQGLTGKIYFVNGEETGDRLCSLQRYEYERYKETKYEVVFKEAELKIMSISLDLDNSEEGMEADIVFFDHKGILHRLHFTRGKSNPTHTTKKITVDDFEKLLKLGQRYHASRQTISLGQSTTNIKNGSQVYKTESHAVA